MSPMIVFVLSRTCNMVQYISEECFNYTSLSHASINAPHTFFLETFLIYIPITKTFLQEFFLTKCTVIITKDTGGLAVQGSSSASFATFRAKEAKGQGLGAEAAQFQAWESSWNHIESSPWMRGGDFVLLSRHDKGYLTHTQILPGVQADFLTRSLFYLIAKVWEKNKFN